MKTLIIKGLQDRIHIDNSQFTMFYAMVGSYIFDASSSEQQTCLYTSPIQL